MCFANINDNKIKGLLWIIVNTIQPSATTNPKT